MTTEEFTAKWQERGRKARLESEAARRLGMPHISAFRKKESLVIRRVLDDFSQIELTPEPETDLRADRGAA